MTDLKEHLIEIITDEAFKRKIQNEQLNYVESISSYLTIREEVLHALSEFEGLNGEIR